MKFFCLLLIVIAVCWSSLIQTDSGATPTTRPDEDYISWVKRFATTEPMHRMFEGDNVKIKMVVTTVHGDNTPKVPDAELDGIMWQQSILTVDGRRIQYSHSDSGTKGGGGGPGLPASTLKQIDDLLLKLPDDGGKLPPAGRRMMVQTMQGKHPAIHVYDRANAPEVVWQLMRLSGCQATSDVPMFKPQSEISARPYQWGGFLCLSPDQKEIFFSSMNGPLSRWDAETHKSLGLLPAKTGGYEIAFSPDGMSAAICADIQANILDVKTWKPAHRLFEQVDQGRIRQLFRPWFTPDGNYLACRTDEPKLWFFDTTNWQHVATPAGIPPELFAYEQSPDAKLAIMERLDGSLELWNVKDQKTSATLDRGVHLVLAVFSPDGKYAAVVTAKKREFAGYFDDVRIRLLDLASGNFIHELRSFEQPIEGNVEGVVWSPDSAYVMAARQFSGSSSCGISMWDAATGKHRGEFVGTPTRVNGLIFTPNKKQIAAGCIDGKIRFWDYQDALTKARDFEKTFISN